MSRLMMLIGIAAIIIMNIGAACAAGADVLSSYRLPFLLLRRRNAYHAARARQPFLPAAM